MDFFKQSTPPANKLASKLSFVDLRFGAGPAHLMLAKVCSPGNSKVNFGQVYGVLILTSPQLFTGCPAPRFIAFFLNFTSPDCHLEPVLLLVYGHSQRLQFN